MLLFEFSIPKNNSWDGKWSGEGKYYARTLSSRSKGLAEPGTYSYEFGNGWVALIKVSEIDSKKAERILKKSAGFCGYEWMITEIMKYGRIRPIEERMQ